MFKFVTIFGKMLPFCYHFVTIFVRCYHFVTTITIFGNMLSCVTIFGLEIFLMTSRPRPLEIIIFVMSMSNLGPNAARLNHFNIFDDVTEFTHH